MSVEVRTGNTCASSLFDEDAEERRGKSADCLAGVITDSKIPRKQLVDQCGYTEGYLSKILSGSSALDFIDSLPKELRIAYFSRRMALEDDIEAVAAEQLVNAAVHFLAVRKKPMAKARGSPGDEA